MTILLVALLAAAPVDASGACARLTSIALTAGTVTAAESVSAGALSQFPSLPAFCRVSVTLKPSSDSDIKMELWMPLANWNGKFQEVGNGAFNGSIAIPAMAAALARGYATASTDTGHTGNTASFALGHPEKLVDFGWRAIHETAVASKRIIGDFYSSAPRLSYFTGCSAGGRQALKAAQRFPADFDGIVAGAPGLDWTGRAAQAVRVAKATRSEGARLSEADARLLHAAVVAACDATDGVKDGVIEDPKQCRFDPAVLQCKGEKSATCLSATQVATAALMYDGRPNPKSARAIGAAQRGSELGWTDRGWSASANATGRDQFRFLVFQDPSWDVDAFDFDRDIVRAEEADRDTINALDPNLKAFFDRGGRLIQYHGWNDPQISPGMSTQYYDRVAAALGGAARIDASYRLFMAPGMAHCGGGEGPNAFDMLGALERWIEQREAPSRIVASRVANGKVERTRPLCPYPQVAVYKGSGSTDDAASFECRVR
jgi:feruloyl esterase